MPEKSNSNPATIPEITIAVGVLFRQLRKPPGVKPEDRMEGYTIALYGFPLEAIEAAVAQVLRREVASIKNPDYCPLPPVLAEIVRAIAPDAVPAKTGQAAKPVKQLFAYRPPDSKIIERNVTKDWAWELIRQGMHPVGSIWCPGQIGDRPDIGDLYGPDPDWQRAVPWPPPIDKTAPVAAELQQQQPHAPMFGRARRMRDWDEPKKPEMQGPPAPRKVPDYSQDKVEPTPELLRSLELRKAMEPKREDRDEGGT